MCDIAKCRNCNLCKARGTAELELRIAAVERRLASRERAEAEAWAPLLDIKEVEQPR